MIDTKELAAKLWDYVANEGADHRIVSRVLDEALAPLLAELDRLRIDRISDREREVEDRAMRVWEAATAAKLSKVATDGSAAYVLALEAAEDAITERDRRRSERKAGG